MRGSRSLNTKDLLKHAVLCQFVPSFLRIYPLYKEVTRTSGILIETAWAGAAFNLFLYMLASHVSSVYDLFVYLCRKVHLREKNVFVYFNLLILINLYTGWKLAFFHTCRQITNYHISHTSYVSSVSYNGYH